MLYYISLVVTEDGLTAKTGLAITEFHCGIGTSFTLHLLIMNFHYIDENKIMFFIEHFQNKSHFSL